MGGDVQLHTGASSPDDKYKDPGGGSSSAGTRRATVWNEAKMLTAMRKAGLRQEPEGAKAGGKARRCPPETQSSRGKHRRRNAVYRVSQCYTESEKGKQV